MKLTWYPSSSENVGNCGSWRQAGIISSEGQSSTQYPHFFMVPSVSNSENLELHLVKSGNFCLRVCQEVPFVWKLLKIDSVSASDLIKYVPHLTSRLARYCL